MRCQQGDLLADCRDSILVHEQAQQVCDEIESIPNFLKLVCDDCHSKEHMPPSETKQCSYKEHIRQWHIDMIWLRVGLTCSHPPLAVLARKPYSRCVTARLWGRAFLCCRLFAEGWGVTGAGFRLRLWVCRRGGLRWRWLPCRRCRGRGVLRPWWLGRRRGPAWCRCG